MELWMKQPNHTEDEVKDKQEVIDILTETIDALEAEIKEVRGFCDGFWYNFVHLTHSK